MTNVPKDPLSLHTKNAPWTPGPWETGPQPNGVCRIYAPSEVHAICRTYGPDVNGVATCALGSPRDAANAKLIALSPMLAEHIFILEDVFLAHFRYKNALSSKLLLEAGVLIVSMATLMRKSVGMTKDVNQISQMTEAIKASEAAIAKAKGGAA